MNNRPSTDDYFNQAAFERRLLMALTTAAALMAGAALLYVATDVFLMVFAAILIAVFFDGMAGWLSQKTPMSRNISFAVVVLGLILLAGVGTWLAAPSFSEQIDQLSRELPRAIEKARSSLTSFEPVRQVMDRFPPQGALPSGKRLMGGAVTAVSSTLGVLGTLLVMGVLGLYFSVQPKTYVEGALKLVTPRYRDRARTVLQQTGSTLRWWLIGKFASMAVVGILTTIGLWFLGIPLVLLLGVLAMLLTFIPNIGPILSAIPAVLFGFVDGPDKALYVALLYIGIQTVESYLITPLIQKRAISMPTALILVSQILLGLLFGFLGIVLATPLMASALVFVRLLYIEDVLGEKK